jgi:drug/metabolite transporter (DMT)-like permease
MSSATAPIHQNLRGILIRCGAVVCFAVMAAAFKWASEDGAGVLEMLFFRGVIGVPVILAWLAAGEGTAAVHTSRYGAHLFRAVLGVASLSLIYQALIRLPMADAVTIGFSAPAFATILSVLLLGEKVGPHRWTAVALGFVGVAIVTRPGGAALPLAGILFAIFGALGNGAATVTIRQMGSRENPAAIAFWFLVFAMLVGGIGMLWVARAHEPATWAALVIGSIAGAGAQLLLTRSLYVAPVSVVVPFDYLQIVWAALFGWLLWATLPGLNTLLGALLIAASGLYTAWREHRLHKAATAPVPVE